MNRGQREHMGSFRGYSKKVVSIESKHKRKNQAISPLKLPSSNADFY